MEDLSPCWMAGVSCFLLASTYVGSLYIWNSDKNRDHPDTVKKRFRSAFCMLFVSPAFVYYTLGPSDFQNVNLYHYLGLKWDGLLPALTLPIILTAVLFAGPLTILFLDEDQSWKTLFSFEHLKNNLNDILWVRNHIVAPVSEEFTFRACMLPQLLKCYSSSQAIFICPLFFGIGHFHHMTERCKLGMPVLQSLLISCFQFVYTTLFGIYAAFLFVRTGHIAAPCVAHAFCNLMGFPDFGEIGRRQGYQRAVLVAAFIGGLMGWCYLLWPLTNPSFYNSAHQA